MEKQTAVNWLVEQVNSDCLNSSFIRPELIEKAKEMEREQIKDAYWNGTVDMEKSDALIEAEYFYNETYNK
jgi:hypothetical protein